jgi:predicted DNA-binding protein (MmcQ/YjbR family)
MNLEEFREYCLSLKGATEDLPFGPDTLVFRVMNKMFAITGINSIPLMATMKCDPERAIELREQYESIIPGYHTNKKMWNSVYLESELSDKLIRELVEHSYNEVVKGLKKTEREELNRI